MPIVDVVVDDDLQIFSLFPLKKNKHTHIHTYKLPALQQITIKWDYFPYLSKRIIIATQALLYKKYVAVRLYDVYQFYHVRCPVT